MLQASFQKLDPREQHYWIASPRAGMQLFLRHLPSRQQRSADVPPVLYVHGATFPSGLSIAHRFDGHSWRDALCNAGFDVWGFDFLGYGYSDRYPEMNEPAEANPPLCRVQDGTGQLTDVARFILRHQGARRLSIISHSWGAMPTCRFAGEHPALVDRIVLFAPIARRVPRRYDKPPSAPAWRIVTLADQLARFVEDVPAREPPVLAQEHFAQWGERYLDSDPDSRTRNPAAVKIPTGPFNDILHAWHGQLGYDPAVVQRRSQSSAANRTVSSPIKMHAGCSMRLLPHRTSATSRSTAPRISCIWRRCVMRSTARASPSSRQTIMRLYRRSATLRFVGNNKRSNGHGRSTRAAEDSGL